MLSIKRLNLETRSSQLLNISLFPSNLFESFQVTRLWKVYIRCTKILFRISTVTVMRYTLFFWPSSSKEMGLVSIYPRTIFLEDINSYIFKTGRNFVVELRRSALDCSRENENWIKKEKQWGVLRGTKFCYKRETFSVLKFLGLCPLFHVVKFGWRPATTSGTDEGNSTVSGILQFLAGTFCVWAGF